MSDPQTPTPVSPLDVEAEFFADPRRLTRLPVAFPLKGGGTMPGWIEVRDEISIGDERKAFATAVKGQVQTKEGETRTEYDHERLSFALISLHLVDWSLKKTYSVDALKNLKPPVYKAIDDVVRKHLDVVKEGNAPTPPVSGDAPTSGSAA